MDPRRFKKVTKAVLEEARRPGNIDGLRKVLASSHAPGGLTMGALESMLVHIPLDGTKLPSPRVRPQPEVENRKYPPLSDEIQVTIMVIKEGLFAAAQLSSMKIRQDMVEEIRPYIPIIVGEWLEISLWAPNPFIDDEITRQLVDPMRTCVWLMHFSERSGPGMRDDLLSSEGIVEYAIGAFAIHAIDEAGKSKGPYSSLAWAQGRCPIATFLWTVLDYSEANRERAIQILTGTSQESKFLQERVVRNTFERSRIAGSMTRNSLVVTLTKTEGDPPPGAISPVATMIAYLETLLSLVKVFWEHPALQKAYMRSEFFPAFAWSLNVWITKNKREGDDQTERIPGFKLANDAQGLVEGYRLVYRKLAVKVWTEMMGYGLLSIVIESLISNVRHNPPLIEIAKSSLARIRNACRTHESVGTVVSLKIDQYKDGKFLKGTSWEVLWKLFIRETMAGMAIPMGNSWLCDNLTCGRTTGSVQKACSVCHVAVYCSALCQELDWKSLHRQECQLARLDYKGREQMETHYTKRQRLDHATRSAFIGYKAIRDRDQTSQTKVTNQSVTVLGTWTETFVPLATWLETHGMAIETQSGAELVTNHYLDNRIQAFARRAAENENLRLVADQYPYGPYTVHVLSLIEMLPVRNPREDDIRKVQDYTFKSCVAKLSY